MKPTSPKMIFKSPFFSSSLFVHLYPSLIKLSTETFPWNKTDKIPNFTGIPSHVTIFTMLEAMSDEVSGNIVPELRKRGNFGGFSEERMQSVLEEMWNKVEYDLKDPRKMAGQLEECSDSEEM